MKTGEGEFESKYKNKTLSNYQKERRRNTNKLYNHVAPVHNEKILRKMAMIKPGENYKNLPEIENKVSS